MNKRLVDSGRAVIAHGKPPKVAQPGDATHGDPALLTASQHAPVLGSRPATIPSRRLMHLETARNQRGPVEINAFDKVKPGTFKRIPTLQPGSEKLTICLLSQEYPPAVGGGIGRLTFELACGLAEGWHSIHMLTKSRTLRANT